MGSGDSSSDTYGLSSTIGQTAAGEFQSQGYFVRAGFQYVHAVIPFTFSLSNANIDFGKLTPQSPATSRTDLRVSFGGAGIYQVTAAEEGPLRTLAGDATIKDTSCNGGSQTCTETNAAQWTSKTAYGFGYNMSGEDIPSDFAGSSYFRPFPDALNGEPPAVIMSNENVTFEPEESPRNTHSSSATFKVNIPSAQPVGSYETVIDFVATPSF